MKHNWTRFSFPILLAALTIFLSHCDFRVKAKIVDNSLKTDYTLDCTTEAECRTKRQNTQDACLSVAALGAVSDSKSSSLTEAEIITRTNDRVAIALQCFTYGGFRNNFYFDN